MSGLWAITAYFNPAGYRRRLHNYRMFRERLAVPLATAEISYTGKFELSDADADVLLRFRSEHVMWQKERLLNLLVEQLPGRCEAVAWIDSDVMFESRQWVSDTMTALEHHGLVHLYEHRVNLPQAASRDGSLEFDALEPLPAQTPSAIFLLAQGQATEADFADAGIPVNARSTVGLAWAGSRRVMQKCGLYDACIVGGADRAILGAALGRFELGTRALRMQGPRTDHYLSWARAFHDEIRGSVGHIPGRAFHLWHGDLRNRQYADRQDLLNQHDFDPSADIALDSQGLWRWNSAKPQLHAGVSAYFASRKEDG